MIYQTGWKESFFYKEGMIIDLTPTFWQKKSLETHDPRSSFKATTTSKVTCLVRKWCFRDVRLLSRCFFNSYLMVSAIILFEVRNSSGVRKHERWLWRWKSTSRCSLIEVLLLEKRVSNHFSGQASKHQDRMRQSSQGINLSVSNIEAKRCLKLS